MVEPFLYNPHLFYLASIFFIGDLGDETAALQVVFLLS